jgi:DNA-3-methyladenine glycosylase II
MKSYKHILAHFKKSDPKIYEVMKNVNFAEWFDEYEDLVNEHELFLALCRKIVGQQLSVKAARAINKRFSDYFAGAISPQKIIDTADQQLRDTGISWAKVKYIKDLATKVINKEIHLDKLFELADEEVTNELIKIKGIGKWTTEMFLIFNLKRENVFSHGDLGLKNGLEKIYKMKNPNVKKIEKVISKWHPYKTFGSIALWHSLDNS